MLRIRSQLSQWMGVRRKPSRYLQSGRGWLFATLLALLSVPAVAIAQTDDPIQGGTPPPGFGGRLSGSYFRPRVSTTAEFTISNPAPRPGDVISFHAVDSPDIVLTYYWTFGDGSQAGGRDVAHSYSAGGTFSVTLQVVDFGMRPRSVTHGVSVISTGPQFNPSSTPSGFALALGDTGGIAPIPGTNDLAVASRDMGVVRVDASNPTNWRIIGAESQPEPARLIGVSGNHAIVICENDQVGRVVNLANMATVAALPYSGQRLAVRGNYACVAHGTAGLHILNISNPAYPSLIATLPINAQDVAISPNSALAYTASYDSLKVINLASTPPQVVLSIPLPGQSYGVSVNAAGTLLAVARYGANSAVQFFSLSSQYLPSTVPPPTPSALNPVPLAATTTGVNNAAGRVVLGGTTAMVCTDGQMWFVDASNPLSPRVGNATYSAIGDGCSWGSDILTTFGSGIRRYAGTGLNYASAGELYSTGDQRTTAAANAQGTLCLVSGQNTGTLVVNTSVPSTPSVIAQLGFISNAAVFSGAYALVATSSDLKSLDMSTPAAPLQRSAITMAARDLCLTQDGFAYTASYGAGVGVVNAGAPAALSFVRFVDTLGSAVGVALSADAQQSRLFVADSASVRVFDIAGARRAAPVEIGSFTLPTDSARSVAVLGQHLFVTGYSSTFVYAITNPTAPSYIQTIGGASSPIRIGEGHAFMPRGMSGTDILEWSSASARYSSRFNLPTVSGRTDAVAVAAGFAFCAEPGSPVVLFDLLR